MKKAFTLSELLITLGIIGVVAAITLPVLINKINNMQYDRAREKVLATVGEAGKILAVQGYLSDSSDAEDLVKNHLSKQVKIIKYCGNSPTQCGFPEKIKIEGKNRINNTELTVPTTIYGLKKDYNSFNTLTRNETLNSLYNYSFLTADGFAINLFFNPKCNARPFSKNDNPGYYSHDDVCINAMYDMNGKKGPNQSGKDIGWVTIIGNNENAVAVAPAFENKDAVTKGLKGDEADSACPKGQSLPSIYELESLEYNIIYTNATKDHYWSALSYKNKYYQTERTLIYMTNGTIYGYSGNVTSSVRCVRR